MEYKNTLLHLAKNRFNNLDSDNIKYVKSCYSINNQHTFTYKSKLSEMLNNYCEITFNIFHLKKEDDIIFRIEPFYINGNELKLSDEFLEEIYDDIMQQFDNLAKYDTTKLVIMTI